MTRSAVETIHRESISAFGIGKETGGILIGLVPSDEIVIISSATGPGHDGKCASFASWETDTDYLNEELKMAREENLAVNLRGFWHRHPGQMSHPSAQDLWEARKILADKKHYKLDGKLIMPIVTVAQERVTIHAYYITDEELWFKEIPVEVVSDSDEMVKSLLASKKAIEVEEETNHEFWRDKDWHFYKSLYGALRLEEELAGLKLLGYKATARLLKDSDCCVEAWKNGGHQRVLFLLPREYPLNPPRVFVKHGEDIRELEADSPSPLLRWSSTFHLAELVVALEGQLRKRTTDKGSARSGILAVMKEDFRHGNYHIFKLPRQLVGLIRGKGKCVW